MATIHLSKSENYRADTFPGILDSLGLSTQLKTAKVVVIKPNLVGYAIDEDRKAKSTPLWIIQETVAGIRACNKTAKILIVESDSGNWKHARDRFINHGLPILEEHDENLQLYNLSENPSDTRPFQGLYFKRRITLPSLFQEEIFFVSLAKVKTHRITVFSGILKNQFGCLPAISKAQYHTDLDRVLADINALIRPSLCILDACPAMEGDGPLHGRDRDLNLIAASDNPVELDAYMLKLTGLDRYKPKFIATCRQALQDHYTMGPPTLVHPELAEGIAPFAYRSLYKRKRFQLGLFIQKYGQKIANVGKRLQRK